MRRKTIICWAVLVILISMASTACTNMKPDPNPYGFVNSRRDG